MHFPPVAIAIVTACAMTGTASANPADICLDPRIRKTTAELVGTWAQGYAFAKVLIGSDGRFGHMLEPTVKEVGNGYIVCHSTYNLVRAGRNGAGYAVRISDLDFRVSQVGDNITISLENLPTQTDGSDDQTRALLSRFTVNNRPYLEILAENQARLNQREN